MTALRAWLPSTRASLVFMGIMLLLCFGAPWFVGGDVQPEGLADSSNIVFSWQYDETTDRIDRDIRDRARELRDERGRGGEQDFRDTMRNYLRNMETPRLTESSFLMFGGLALLLSAFLLPNAWLRLVVCAVYGLVFLRLHQDTGLTGWIAVGLDRFPGSPMILSLKYLVVGQTLIMIASELNSFRPSRRLPIRILAGVGCLIVIVSLMLPMDTESGKKPILLSAIELMQNLDGDDWYIDAGQLLVYALPFVHALLVLIALLKLLPRRRQANPAYDDPVLRGGFTWIIMITLTAPVWTILLMYGARSDGVFFGALLLLLAAIPPLRIVLRLIALAIGTVVEFVYNLAAIGRKSVS